MINIEPVVCRIVNLPVQFDDIFSGMGRGLATGALSISGKLFISGTLS